MSSRSARKSQSKRDPYIEWTADMMLTVHVLQTDFKDERNTMAKRIAFTKRHQRALPEYSPRDSVPWNKISRQYVERQSLLEAQRQKWTSILSVDLDDRSVERSIMHGLIEDEKRRPTSCRLKDESGEDGLVQASGAAAACARAIRNLSRGSSAQIKEECSPDRSAEGQASDPIRSTGSRVHESIAVFANKNRRPAVSAEPPVIAREQHRARPVRVENPGNVRRRNALMPTAATEILFALSKGHAAEAHDDLAEPTSEDVDSKGVEPKAWFDAHFVHSQLTPHQRQTLENMKSFAGSSNILDRFDSFEGFRDFVEAHRAESEILLYAMLQDRFGEDEHELY